MLPTGSVRNSRTILFTSNYVLKQALNKNQYIYVVHIWEIHCSSVLSMFLKWNITDVLPFQCISLGIM